MPGYYTIIFPLKRQNNLLSITDPLSFDVWVCLLMSIPTFLGVMCFTNYIYGGSPNWEASWSFVLRNVVSEHMSRLKLPDKHLYQKLLIALWSWMTLVLITAYSGNLTAIITTPALKIPFTSADGMIRQTQIKWAAWDNSLFSKYANGRPHGTLLSNLIQQALLMSLKAPDRENCYTSKLRESGDIASICDVTEARFLASRDYGKTGQCNYYLTDDKFLAADNFLAFQVRRANISTLPSHIVGFFFAERKSALRGRKQFTSPCKTDGTD